MIEDFERIDMEGADVFLGTLSGFDDAFETIVKETKWSRKKITIQGKTSLQPRLIAWYGDEGTHYSYAGESNEPLPWTPYLTTLREYLEKALGVKFNSVLLNLYRDGDDKIGFHSDDEKELGVTIASLSFGAERRFDFRYKWGPGFCSVPLVDHSILLMTGMTQMNWEHGIERQAGAKPRLNLTFRYVVKEGQFDAEKRKLEKEWARQRDAQRLASGGVSRDDLRKENSLFPREMIKNSQIVLGRDEGETFE